MCASNALKLLVILVIFTFTTTLAIEIASSPDSNDETPSRNVSCPESEPSLLLRMLKRRQRGRMSCDPRRRRPLPHTWRPWVASGSAGEWGGKRVPAVVALDGSGNFPTIKAALDASVRSSGHERFTIHIKAGVYKEILVIEERMKNIEFTGDGIGRTIITGSNSKDDQNFGTWNAATILVKGDGFVARDLTFQNTNRLRQAPAITIQAPHSAFYRVRFDGYQDTIFVQHGQQFFKECDVYGTVDFICGDGTAVFQNTNIIARRSYTGNQITIASSRRASPDSHTGIVFHNCRITASNDLQQVFGSTKIYLGRPWGAYSRTIYMKCDFDLPIHPEGWLAWEGAASSNANTVDYREFGNSGMGSSTGGRVRWAGYRVMTDASEANQFTVANHIQGDTWLPRTGVPFKSGL